LRNEFLRCKNLLYAPDLKQNQTTFAPDLKQISEEYTPDLKQKHYLCKKSKEYV